MKKSSQQLVGNDVVDLQLAHKQSNWKRAGYLNKLFNADEQGLIHHAQDPALLLWLMWTMKESAYKIANRASGMRIYSPLSFTCSKLLLTNTGASGEVSYQQQTFYTKTDIKPLRLHSIALMSLNDLDVIKIHQQQHTNCYLADFNRIFVDYELSKNTAGLPELLNRNTGKKCAVSISHHGRHLAIAYSDSPLSAD